MVECYEWLAPLTFRLVGKELIFWQCMLDVRDEFYPFVRIETSLSRGTKFVPKNVIFLNRRDLEKQRKANFNSLERFNLAQAVLSCYRFDPCSWGELPAFFYDYFCRFNFFNWMLFLGMNSYINLGNLDPTFAQHENLAGNVRSSEDPGNLLLLEWSQHISSIK